MLFITIQSQHTHTDTLSHTHIHTHTHTYKHTHTHTNTDIDFSKRIDRAPHLGNSVISHIKPQRTLLPIIPVIACAVCLGLFHSLARLPNLGRPHRLVRLPTF